MNFSVSVELKTPDGVPPSTLTFAAQSEKDSPVWKTWMSTETVRERNALVQIIHELCTSARSNLRLVVYVSQTVEGGNVGWRHAALLGPFEINSRVVVVGGAEGPLGLDLRELYLGRSGRDVHVFPRLPRPFGLDGPLAQLETGQTSLAPVPKDEANEGEAEQGEQGHSHLQTGHPAWIAPILRGRSLGHQARRCCVFSVKRVRGICEVAIGSGAVQIPGAGVQLELVNRHGLGEGPGADVLHRVAGVQACV